jgi:hypothetical protein
VIDKQFDEFTNDRSETVEEMRSHRVIKVRSQNFYSLLEEDLGVPFFKSIEAIAKLRISTLTNVQMFVYSSFLLGGIEKRHLWLESDNFISSFITTICGERLYKVPVLTRAMISESTKTVSMMVTDDLLTALGRFERTFHPLTGAMILNKADVLALDKVHSLKTKRWMKIAEILVDL